MLANSTAITATMDNTTLRYVTVFQAIWSPCLRFEEAEANKNQPNQENMGYSKHYHKAN